MRANIDQLCQALKDTLKRWAAQLNQPVPPSSKVWRYALAAVLGVFVCVTFFQSLAVPIFEGSDEQRHYAYVRYLVNNLALPPHGVANEDWVFTYKVAQEAGQPPLYYIPVAWMTAWVPDADNVAPFVVHNSFVGLYDVAGLPFDNHNAYLHGAEERFPFHGVALAVHLGRLLSIVCGVLTLLGVFGIARAVVPAKPAVALLAVVLIVSVPGFVYVHSVITNDVSVILFVTLSLWVAVRIAREGPTRRLAVWGGIFGALTLLSKVNGAWAVGIVWFALIVSAVIHRREKPFWSVLPTLGLSVGVWLVIIGPWVTYTISQHDLLGLSIHALGQGQGPLTFAFVGARSLADDLDTWEHTTWYAAGWSIVYGPQWIYETFRYLYLGGLLGALGLGLVTLFRRAATWAGLLQTVCLCLAVLFALAGGIYWQLVYGWRLGRLLYPGLVAAVVVVAVGWVFWLSLLRKAHLPYAVNWAFALVIAVVLIRAFVGSTLNTFSALWPHPMITSADRDVTPTRVTFLDPADKRTPVATVIGYRLPSQSVQVNGVLFADICWQSEGYNKGSYPYSLQLVGPNDVRPGTRNSYHGLGTFPISAWSPKERFCDPTSVLVGMPIDRPRAYNLVVTLFELDTLNFRAGPPLPSVDGAGRAVYPVIGRVRVAPEHQPVVMPTVNLGSVAGLVSSTVQLQTNNTLSLTLRWVALGTTPVSEKVFLHVVDNQTGQVIAQADHEPDEGWFPTDYWQPKDVVEDSFSVVLPSRRDLSNVTLRVGMYDPQTGARLATLNLADGQRYPDDAIVLNP